ncbi:MAG TPA: phosphodiester glycosidase family protein [Tepidiformaceae bacterium]|nr:phosphodiester glycosidase family protein [Tepidiformaceae bacterium]
MLRGFGLRRAELGPEPASRAVAEEPPLLLQPGEEAERWDPEPIPALEGEPGRQRRRLVTWRRALLAACVIGLAVAGGAYSQKERIAPEVADLSRRLIGDEKTARVEGWFFQIEDRIDKTKYRLLGGETNPFAVAEVQVLFAPKAPGREVFVFVGKGTVDDGSLALLDAFRPIPMRPPDTKKLRDHPEAGEGVWTTAGLPAGPVSDPAMMKTFIRPDTSRPYALVGVLLLDHRKVRLHLVGGTVDPGGDRGVKGPGTIPQGDQGSLLAAWNGGFKGPHGGFGMVADGVTYRPLRNGLATLCVKKSGALVMGEYGRDVTWDDTMEACRQNVILLVDKGEVSRRTTEGNDTWGYVQVNSSEFITWRSAVGVTKDGNLLVASGNSLSAETLAKALWAAGAEYAMQLDINSPYVLTGLFFKQPDGSLKSEKFMETMPDTASRFLKTQERDFMYVTRDERTFR